MDSDIVLSADGRPMRRVKKVRAQEQSEDAGTGDAALRKQLSRGNDPLLDVSRGSGRSKTLQEEAEILRQLQTEAAAVEQANARGECPVPKPKGVLGRLFGFEENNKDVEKSGLSMKPRVAMVEVDEE